MRGVRRPVLVNLMPPMAAPVVGVGVASAFTTHSLNVDYCTSSYLNGATGGTVTLHDTGGPIGHVRIEVPLSGGAFYDAPSFASSALPS